MTGLQVILTIFRTIFFIVGVWSTLVNFYQSQGDAEELPLGNVIVQAVCIVGFVLLKEGWVL